MSFINGAVATAPALRAAVIRRLPTSARLDAAALAGDERLPAARPCGSCTDWYRDGFLHLG